jgi:hypothetical protein
VQKLLNNPPRLQLLLDQEIAALDRLVERAMKKKPKSAKGEEEKAREAYVGV